MLGRLQQLDVGVGAGAQLHTAGDAADHGVGLHTLQGHRTRHPAQHRIAVDGGGQDVAIDILGAQVAVDLADAGVAHRAQAEVTVDLRDLDGAADPVDPRVAAYRGQVQRQVGRHDQLKVVAGAEAPDAIAHRAFDVQDDVGTQLSDQVRASLDGEVARQLGQVKSAQAFGQGDGMGLAVHS